MVIKQNNLRYDVRDVNTCSCLWYELIGGLQDPSSGYAIPRDDRAMFYTCKSGEWCVLGRSTIDSSSGNVTNLKCPQACYCPTSDVLTPTVCAFSSEFANYCPEGSINQTACPLGHYCSLPNKTAVCAPHRFCPYGSFKSDPCPAGYYCPTSSELFVCPAGSYCKPGSVKPRPCSVFTICKQGSTSPTNSFGSLLGLFVLFFIPFVGWRIYLHYRDKRRKQRVKAGKDTKYSSFYQKHSSHSRADTNSRNNSKYSSLSAPLLDEKSCKRSSEVALQELHRSKNDDIAICSTNKRRMNKFFVDFRFENLGLRLKSCGGYWRD